MTFPTDGLIGSTPASIGADTTAKHAVGTRVNASSGQVWVYVLASADISASWCVAVSNAFSASGMTKALADLGYQPANALYAIPSGSYGWVAIHGQGLTQTVLGSCDKGVVLCTSAVTGVLDDATASQTKVWGAVAITSAGTTATTNVTLNLVFPHTQLAGA